MLRRFAAMHKGWRSVRVFHRTAIRLGLRDRHRLARLHFAERGQHVVAGGLDVGDVRCRLVVDRPLIGDLAVRRDDIDLRRRGRAIGLADHTGRVEQ